MKRNKFVFGNWKMNMSFNDIIKFSQEFNHLIKSDKKLNTSKVIFGIAPTYLCLHFAYDKLIKSTQIGAQNCHYENHGAFTSQISYSQLKDFAIKYVILGHSEVRQYLHETDELINKKVLKLLSNEMIPILCIGETLEQYEKGDTVSVLKEQIIKCLKDVNPSDLSNLIIAYEPIWAIGTGKTPSLEEIENLCSEIRKILESSFGKNADKIRILYGGSVNENNADSIFKLKNVDGGLIGGASMKAKSFYNIISSAIKNN